MASPFELILFDLDGTLIDSREDITNSMNHALVEIGLSPLSESLIASFVGKGIKTLVAKVLGSENDPRIPQLRSLFRDHYYKHSLDKTMLYQGIFELIHQLSGRELAIVTNKPEAMSEKVLSGLNIRQHFKWLVGGDTFPVIKPDPQVVSNILKESLKNIEKMVMIGDSKIDIELAKNIGITSIGVCYGYRPELELKDAGADYIVHHVSELAEILLG